MSTDKTAETIAEILRDNINFAPQVNGLVIHGAIEKIQELIAQQSRERAIAVLNWVTRKESMYAVMYGDQDERFADEEREYTPDEIYDLFLIDLAKQENKTPK